MLVRLITCWVFLVTAVWGNAQTWGWNSTGGGILSDKALDMDMDADGNLYVCGYFNNGSSAADVSFSAISIPTGGFGKEGFLGKMDPAGNWVWVQQAVGGWDERVLGMHVDKKNECVYVTGTAWMYTGFGSCPAPAFPGSSDEIFIGKFDLNGNCQWLVGAGGNTDDHGYDLVTDTLGNLYVTGYISDKYAQGGVIAHFGPHNIPVPYADSLAYVAKLNPAGVFQWVKTFDGVEGERDNRIAIDKDQNLYVTGGFHGMSSFGPYWATSLGGIDIYVVKLDPAGNIQWVKTAGSTLDDRGNDIMVDTYNDIYVTGEFRDKVSFDGDSVNNNGSPSGRDIFVAKMKTNGNWVWGKKAGSNKGSERGNRIIGNANGNIFVTGQIFGDADFGPIHLNNNDSLQIFTASIDTSGKWKWALHAGSYDIDRGTGLAVDSCTLYTCGYYTQTAWFGADTLHAKGKKDMFVTRILNACTVNPIIAEPPVVDEDTCVLIIPNVFTPNNDQLNENFTLADSCILELKLHIYNRWGENVHTLEKPFDAWDGMWNGQPASEGVYYYTGNATLSDKRIVALKGFVTLLR